MLIERNTLVMLPFVDARPDSRTSPTTTRPAIRPIPAPGPRCCTRFRRCVLPYAIEVWTLQLALLVPKQPYRAIGGIHVRAGSERVRILENRIVGGAGNGITLGGDLDPVESDSRARPARTA